MFENKYNKEEKGELQVPDVKKVGPEDNPAVGAVRTMKDASHQVDDVDNIEIAVDEEHLSGKSEVTLLKEDELGEDTGENFDAPVSKEHTEVMNTENLENPNKNKVETIDTAEVPESHTKESEEDWWGRAFNKPDTGTPKQVFQKPAEIFSKLFKVPDVERNFDFNEVRKQAAKKAAKELGPKVLEEEVQAAAKLAKKFNGVIQGNFAGYKLDWYWQIVRVPALIVMGLQVLFAMMAFTLPSVSSVYESAIAPVIWILQLAVMMRGAFILIRLPISDDSNEVGIIGLQHTLILSGVLAVVFGVLAGLLNISQLHSTVATFTLITAPVLLFVQGMIINVVVWLLFRRLGAQEI